MSDDFMLDTDDLQRRMDGAMASLKTEFASLRTGRASASMLEPVFVDAVCVAEYAASPANGH